MSQNATVSPQGVPNRCQCGHELITHTTGTPGTCKACQGGAGNLHDFVGCNEIWPRVGFYQNVPKRFISPGGAYPGGSPNPQSLVSSAGNPAGGLTVAFPALSFNNLNPGPVPGMCITSSVSGLVNQSSYKIVAVNNVTNTITVDRPLVASLGNQRCFFYATEDGNMGPARPPNGQRAG